jgi:hypothetical protein
VKEEVSKVCSINEGTQKKITALMGYLDKAPTEVGLLLSHPTCTAIHNTYLKAIKNELKGLEDDVKEGFTVLQSTINNLTNQIQSSIHEWERNWERNFGLSASVSYL